MARQRTRFVVAIIASMALLMGACGGDSSDEAAPTTTGATVAPVADDSGDPPSDPTDSADDSTETTDAPPEEPVASGTPGEIVLTIGDETWEFTGALCAFRNAPAGEAGSEWNVSMKQGDLQVYVSEDSYGSSVSITDVVNYGTFEWGAEGDAISLNVDGNDITAEGTFTDNAEGNPPTEGTLTATCANWAQG